MKKSPKLLMLALDGAIPGYIKQLVKQNKLPAFARLMEEGVFFEDGRSPFPTITPTCWSSLATGARPSTHGATCQDLLVKGKTPNECISAYHSDNLLAPPFWKKLADEKQNCMIMQLPASGPVEHPHILQVGGASCAAIRKAQPDLPTSASQPQIPAMFLVTKDYQSKAMWHMESPASGQWQPIEKERYTHVIDQNEQDQVFVHCVPNKPFLPFDWYVEIKQGGVRVWHEQDPKGVEIKQGQWSSFIKRDIPGESKELTLGFRMKLFEADPKNKKLKLFITEAGDTYIQPQWFKELADQIQEVPPQHGHHAFMDEGLDGQTLLEAEKMSFDWQLALYEKACTETSIAMSVIYSVYLDSLNHRYRSILEGVEEADQQTKDHVKAFYEKCYTLADQMLQRLMYGLDEDTTLVVVSDHGSVGYNTLLDPGKALQKHGLLVYDENQKIDWQQTKAYPFSTCHIYVNQKGREPYGIVEKDQAPSIQAQIIRALQAEFKERLAFALRNEEAGLVGLGKERTGDVVFGLAGGSAGGVIGGVHAVQSPTARSKTGDIRPLIMMKGPKFKKNVKLDATCHLYDVAPTLCYALGWPQPDQVEGAVMFQALEKESKYEKRG